MTSTEIRFDGVGHAYGDRTVLADVDLTLTERRIGIVGVNGGGKSTLARMINGLVVPTTGTVTVDGLDTRRKGAAIRRRRSCPGCQARFTTFERVQLRELTVIKTDGRRAPFDREKLARSIRIALRKRPVDEDRVERIVRAVRSQPLDPVWVEETVARLERLVASGDEAGLAEHVVELMGAGGAARRTPA